MQKKNAARAWLFVSRVVSTKKQARKTKKKKQIRKKYKERTREGYGGWGGYPVGSEIFRKG
jgi:hypothetical protein